MAKCRGPRGEKRDGEEWRDAQMKEMRDQSAAGREIKRSNETPWIGRKRDHEREKKIVKARAEDW